MNSPSNTQSKWGSPVEVERRNRIRLSVAAYAYEMMGDSTMSDEEYDALSKKIDTSISTGHDELDKFFREEFADYTGSWIHRHPELDKVDALYHRLKAWQVDSHRRA